MTDTPLLDPDFDDLDVHAPPDSAFWRKRLHKRRRQAINRRYYARHQAKVGSRARKAIDESDAEELAACGDFSNHEDGK